MRLSGGNVNALHNGCARLPTRVALVSDRRDAAAALLEEALEALPAERPLYYSEADLQHALAWVIQRQHPAAAIRLEVPLLAGGRERLDLLVVTDRVRLAVELKFPRARYQVELDGEPTGYRRGSLDAIDDTRYAVVEDLRRLERLVEEEAVDVGAVVVVTNAASIWTPPVRSPAALDVAFRLHEGAQLVGDLVWAEGGRAKETVSLRGRYPCL